VIAWGIGGAVTKVLEDQEYPFFSPKLSGGGLDDAVIVESEFHCNEDQRENC
jgi:hypothetical protein